MGRDVAALKILQSCDEFEGGFGWIVDEFMARCSHVLVSAGRVWAIDNGLCFSAPFKLRTVIWEFAGEPIPAALLERVARIADRVPIDIAALLGDDEIDALQYRATALLRTGVFPADRSGHRYPWPLV